MPVAKHAPRILDEARLLPHLRTRARLADGETMVPRREAAEKNVSTPAPQWKTSAGDVDKEKLRGLPMIAPGVRGAQRGSDPLAETIRRSERRR